ncbi:MAG: C69 family dipeptidase [Rikenellaceae bacterium]
MKKLLFLLLFVGASYLSALACSNVMVTKGASKNGSTMISYLADSHQLYGALYFLPAANHPEGAMRTVREWDTGEILGEIPEVAHTYSVVGNMNEHQLLIGESTWTGRRELQDTTGIIDYGSLMYIALQRCKTAREAIECMAQLVSEYGYYSTGESISIADGEEVWYLEIIGKGTKMVKDRKTKQMVNANKGAVWVARRIPDGMISAHANQARITTFPLNDPENCLYSSDVISFAREAGYYEGTDEDFSFADAYNPLDFGGMRWCEARVWSIFRRALTDGSMEQYLDYALGHDKAKRMPLWVKPTEKLDVADVAALMRDHYEGTVMDLTKQPGAGPFELPYRWKLMTFEVDGKEYVSERAISTQQTGWWYVGESRKNLPDEIGGLFWFGVDDTYTAPLTPYYASSTRIATALKEGNGSMLEYSPTSLFWLVNRVSNFAYLKYNYISKDILKAMSQWESARYAERETIDNIAMELYKKDPSLAVEYLTDYSVNTAQDLFQRWTNLDGYLLVKYMDGNIKKEAANGEFLDNGNNYSIPMFPDRPGFPRSWEEEVAASEGSEILLKVEPKN